MHGFVTYLFDVPLFPRGPWTSAFGLSWFLCVGYSCVLYFPSMYVSLQFFLRCFFLLTRTSCLAPTAQTLLGVLGRAAFNFASVVALLFLDFHACATVFDLAKQGPKMFLGGF